MGLYQTKNLLYRKGNNQQSEKQPMEWEKILVNHISDKVWISKIYKEFQKFNCNTTNNLILK